MKPRHAAALTEWVSRVLAVVLLAIIFAGRAKLFDTGLLQWIKSDPKSFVAHERHVHSHSIAFWTISLSLMGLVYIGLIESLAWLFRKSAKWVTQPSNLGHSPAD